MPVDSVVPLEAIADQRARGWPDFGPEDYCHRCGRPNVCWFVASPLWNAAQIESETPSGIVCPECFVAAFEARVNSPVRADGGVAWELKPDPGTLHHLPDELRLDAVVWTDAYEHGALSEYHAARERAH